MTAGNGEFVSLKAHTLQTLIPPREAVRQSHGFLFSFSAAVGPGWLFQGATSARTVCGLIHGISIYCPGRGNANLKTPQASTGHGTKGRRQEAKPFPFPLPPRLPLSFREHQNPTPTRNGCLFPQRTHLGLSRYHFGLF